MGGSDSHGKKSVRYAHGPVFGFLNERKKDDAIMKDMGMDREKVSRNLSRHRRRGLSKGEISPPPNIVFFWGAGKGPDQPPPPTLQSAGKKDWRGADRDPISPPPHSFSTPLF